MFEVVVLLDEVFVLGEAACPAQTPVSDQRVEDAAVELQGLVEAAVQVIQGHFVLVLVLEQQTKVTSNGKKKIVIEGRQEL